MPQIGLFALETTHLFFLSFLDILKYWTRRTETFSFLRALSAVLSILSNSDNVLSNLFMW